MISKVKSRPSSMVRLRASDNRDTHLSSLAICVCAYNEAAIIRTTIENLLALRNTTPDLQILLHVDGMNDGTADIASEYSDRIDLVVSSERHGKTYGMNKLIGMAKAPIVVLTDATVHIDQSALLNLIKYFDDSSVGCVCGTLRYVNMNESVTSYVGSQYWRLEELIKQRESDTGSVMGADGSIYAIRRSLFKQVPEDMIDDMYISLNILCDGYRIVHASDVLAYERSVPNSNEEFKRKIRIACQAYYCHQVLLPRLTKLGVIDLYKYISHKWIRWFTAYTLGVAFILFATASSLLIGIGMTFSAILLGVTLIVAGYLLRIPPVPMIVDILMSFTATAIGITRAMFGHRIRTWEPALSIRNSKEAVYD